MAAGKMPNFPNAEPETCKHKSLALMCIDFEVCQDKVIYRAMGTGQLQQASEQTLQAD